MVSFVQSTYLACAVYMIWVYMFITANYKHISQGIIIANSNIYRFQIWKYNVFIIEIMDFEAIIEIFVTFYNQNMTFLYMFFYLK